MSNDPRDPGDEDDDEAQANKRTRLVMRPDVAEGSPAAGTYGGDQPRGGSVIGATRLVGFGKAGEEKGGARTPEAPAPRRQAQARTQVMHGGTLDTNEPVAGWIVVVKGPGRGGFRPVFVGMNAVGRAPSQRICLDFGDETISREEHAFITYDDEQQIFYLQHGGKSNLVRLAGKPVLAPTELKPNDLFRIGNTTFRFVALCGPDFSWSREVDDG